MLKTKQIVQLRPWAAIRALLWLPLFFATLHLQSTFAAEDPTLDTKTQKAAPAAFADDKPKPVPGWGEGDHKSYWVPVLDIFLFDFTLNQYNRRYSGTSDYDVSYGSFKHNLSNDWVYDNDSFSINQFGHPYQGSMYHGFSRSAGLSYWEASAYTFLGSAAWEIAGETTSPSINDQFTTGFGGSFLGEPLFRMASLFLESGRDDGGFHCGLRAGRYGASPMARCHWWCSIGDWRFQIVCDATGGRYNRTSYRS